MTKQRQTVHKTATETNKQRDTQVNLKTHSQTNSNKTHTNRSTDKEPELERNK